MTKTFFVGQIHSSISVATKIIESLEVVKSVMKQEQVSLMLISTEHSSMFCNDYCRKMLQLSYLSLPVKWRFLCLPAPDLVFVVDVPSDSFEHQTFKLLNILVLFIWEV